MSEGHPLTVSMREAAYGRFPSPDLAVDVLPAIPGISAAVVSFTGHNCIAADLDRSEVLARLPSGDPGAPLNPMFLAWLAEQLDAYAYTPDAVLSALPTNGSNHLELVRRDDLSGHPRVELANLLRGGVVVYALSEGEGLLTLGRRLSGLIDVSIEVEPGSRNRGLGRDLALAARSLVGKNEPLLAEVSPGDAASMRAFLAAGYVPMCSAVFMLPMSKVQKN